MDKIGTIEMIEELWNKVMLSIYCGTWESSYHDKV